MWRASERFEELFLATPWWSGWALALGIALVFVGAVLAF